jgi:hypothetical protein
VVHLSFHKKTVVSVVAVADQAQSSPSNFLLDLDSNCCYKKRNFYSKKMKEMVMGLLSTKPH